MDILYLVFLIIPSFVVGLRFFTAPVYLKYGLRINALIAPIVLPAIFYSKNTDIILMGVLPLFMNLYAFWGHADPPQESYCSGKYTRSSRDTRKIEENSNDLLGTGMSIDQIAGGFGIPAMNYMSNYQT